MDNIFEIHLNFNVKKMTFPDKLLKDGFSVKLEIEIEDTKVIFEPDEERNWRALISLEDMGPIKN